MKYGLYTIVMIIACGYISVCHSQQIIETPPDEKTIDIEEAWTFFHDKDFGGALNLLKDLLKKYPKDPEIEHTLGVFYLRNREWDNAVKHFQDSLVHEPDDILKLWNHIYLAEIFRSKNFLEKARGHLDFVESHELTSLMIRGVAQIRMDIRIMEQLDQTKHFDKLTVRFPKYLIPDEKIDDMGRKLNEDWKQVTSFLNLASDQSFEVFVYPTSRMMERFFPANSLLRQTNFTHHQVHTLYYEEEDYLSSLSLYGHYLLSLKYNRHGSIPWLIDGIDDAIRGIYDGVPVHTWVSELKNQKKIPAFRFLIDPQYLNQMDPGISNPTAGSFILYMKNEVHPNDFLYLLAQTNLESYFEKSLERIESDWLKYAGSERSLLANIPHVTSMIEKVEKFIEPPIIDMDLVNDLNNAALLYEQGKTDSAQMRLDSILSKEPRYGEALYLKGKIFYDNSEIFEAKDIFLDAIKYLPNPSQQLGWAYYFLGRIARLQKNFEEARYYYYNAAFNRLPKDTMEFCQSMVFKIDKYLYLAPDSAAEVLSDDIQGLNLYLQYIDDVINAHDWEQLKQQTAFNLNEDTLQEFVDWYKDPDRFRDNVRYKHELIKAELSENTTKIKVLLKVKYPDELEDFDPEHRTPMTMSLRDLTYTRFFLLTQLPEGWRILDYFDEIELYR